MYNMYRARLLHCNYDFCTHMHTPLVPPVPQFTISPPNVTVMEGVHSTVEVCVSRVGETFLDRNVTVTVQTGPKSEADAQATGMHT